MSVNKNGLVANKLTHKMWFPIIGIISFFSGFLGLLFLGLLTRSRKVSKYMVEHKWVGTMGLIFLVLGLILGIIGLSFGEFWLWSVLGISFIPIMLIWNIIDALRHGTH
jgi:hypothetical protein